MISAAIKMAAFVTEMQCQGDRTGGRIDIIASGQPTSYGYA